MILSLTMNPALDIYSRVEKIKPTQKMRCEKSSIDPGGGGINVSRVIKRLGGESTAIFTCGGYTGNIFKNLLAAEGIKQDPLKIQNSIRENFAVTELSSGKLFRFGFSGPLLQEPEIEKILQKISDYKKADFLVASGSLPPGVPMDFYARVAGVAKKNEMKFVLDTSGKAYEGILTEGAYLLKPNQNELEDLLGGQKANNRKEQKEMLLEVVNNYPVEILILSLGGEGALVATKTEVKHYPAPSVKQISSIGAGDSMVAGIVHQLFNGVDLQQAVLFGLACGSATLCSPGTELLQKKDVEKLYHQLQKQFST